jgi:SAM-dependent methyltransferase
MTSSVRPAVLAFETAAESFDRRFGVWASVTAQRRAVRSVLLDTLPSGGRVLEIGGGTGEDASFLANHGFHLLLTDPSPAMVKIAASKLVPLGSTAEIAAGEEMDQFSERYLSSGRPLLDGAFSNFAPLNCVADLRPVARGLSGLLRQGAPALLVLFGTCCPAEMLIETLRGRPRQALRRFQRGMVPARLAKQDFQIVYHRRMQIERAFAPWFVLERRVGIGLAVPPSAAEPWISTHPDLLSTLEGIDRFLAGSFSPLADHVLYQFRRR